MITQPSDEQFHQPRALWPFVKRLFAYGFQYKVWFLPFIIAVILVALIEAVIPLVWLEYIDTVITPLVTEYKADVVAGIEPDIEVGELYRYGAIYLALEFLQMVASGVFIYHAGKIEEHVVRDLRQDMFDKLQHLSFSYYDRSAIGWLISRITSDSDRVTELISWGFLSLIWGVIMIIACLIVMTLYSLKLTLIILATIPFLMLLSVRLRLRVLQYSRQARRIHSEMTAVFAEHINGVEVNKTSAQEEQATETFSGYSSNMRRASFLASFYSATYSPLVVMVGSVAAALVIYVGGHMTLEASTGITLGVLAAFFGYARIIYDPILDITRFYALAQSCLSAGERIFSLLDEKIEIYDRGGVSDYEEIKGDIEFDGLHFHYVPEKPILQDLNLKIEAGESIALVGPSGEGKSTIANVICRFYEPTAGALKIDGHDYQDKTLTSLRNQLGVILQTPHIFSGTIAENIRYADQNASVDDIARVLESIGASEMIDRLDEEVGEEGGNLSTGEKQLISFARVILKDPKILIMDEATSSVDTLAEMKIQKGIEQLIQNRTSIIIAHRLSTIRNCDRILVIRKGNVIEDGNHDALIAGKGFYHDLYTKQARG